MSGDKFERFAELFGLAVLVGLVLPTLVGLLVLLGRAK